VVPGLLSRIGISSKLENGDHVSIDGPYLKLREWGSEESTTMPATSRADGSVILQDSEKILDRTNADIRLTFYNKGPDGKAIESQSLTSWDMDDFEIITTTQRLIYIKHDWAEGNKYVGLGGGGAAIALAAGAVSKRRAKARAAGTALMGQIPFEWPRRVSPTQGKGLIGRSKTHIFVSIVSKNQFLHFDLQMPNAVAPVYAKLLAAAICRYRLSPPSVEGAADVVKTRLASQAECPTLSEDGRYELTWWAEVRL